MSQGCILIVAGHEFECRDKSAPWWGTGCGQQEAHRLKAINSGFGLVHKVPQALPRMRRSQRVANGRASRLLLPTGCVGVLAHARRTPGQLSELDVTIAR
jgi:hypothetical protein